MYNIMYEMSHESRFDARYWMLGLVHWDELEGLHGCSNKAQPLLLTLDQGYLLTTALPDLQHGIAPLGPPVPGSHCSLDVGLVIPATASGLRRGGVG